jgi:two-component system, NarL family, nitrate/nitrite response regulator NarL
MQIQDVSQLVFLDPDLGLTIPRSNGICPETLSSCTGKTHQMNSRDARDGSNPETLRSAGEQPPDGRAVTVIVASPRSDLRDRLKEELEGPYCPHEVSRWEALDRTISKVGPGVVLLDAELLHSNGITDLSIIRRIAHMARVILLSPSPSDEEGIAGLRAGARGYCETGVGGPQLLKAVDRVREGEIWAERRLIPLLVERCSVYTEEPSEPAPRSDRRLALLTRREREIASLIGAGASNRDIAGRLLVSEGTVKAHLTAIFRKLGFSDRLRLGLFLAKPGSRSRHRH